jgi:hypothetical protein
LPAFTAGDITAQLSRTKTPAFTFGEYDHLVRIIGTFEKLYSIQGTIIENPKVQGKFPSGFFLSGTWICKVSNNGLFITVIDIAGEWHSG